MAKKEKAPVAPRKNRWASKAECEAYLAKHNPTGLRKCAALDYLNGVKKGAQSK